MGIRVRLGLARRRGWLALAMVVVVAVPGCGRLGFDPIGGDASGVDGGAPTDAAPMDGALADAGELDGALADAGDAPSAPLARPIAPASTSIVGSSSTPRFEFELVLADVGRVEVCQDRACSVVVATADGASPLTLPALPAPRVIEYFWRVTPLVGGAPAGPASPSWALWVRLDRGVALDVAQGASVDADGDGRAELVVAAPDLGEVRVHVSTAAGVPALPTWTITGPASFGTSVAAAGDTDGDGLPELIIGAPGSDSARLVELGPGGPVEERTLTGAAGSGFGAVVEGIGDVDRDGYADVAIASGAARVEIFHGGPGGLGASPTTTRSGGASFGAALASGDFDGDGFADLAIGEPMSDRVTIFHGSAVGLEATARVTLAGAAASRFGASIAGDADVTADGYGDLVVGAPGASVALVFAGSASSLPGAASFTLDEGLAGYGHAVAAVTDVDVNGYDDVYVSDGAGNVYAYYAQSRGVGVVPGWEQLVPPPGGAVRWGDVIAVVPDLDADGYADTAVGDVAATALHVVHGSGGGSGRLESFIGAAGSGVGRSVCRP